MDRKVYLFERTILSEYFAVFDGRGYSQKKGEIKFHTLLHYDICPPSYLFLTEYKQSFIKHARYIKLSSGRVLVAERGYQDFKKLNQWKEYKITFVIKLKIAINTE